MEVLGVVDPAALDRARDLLLEGRAVVVPTDTVYGVAALPSSPGAMEEMRRLKGRPPEVPMAVLVTSASEGLALAARNGPGATVVDRLVSRFWPGPLTVVVRRGPAASGMLLGGDPSTIGIRCPDHDWVRSLTGRVGPLAVSSANRHGEPTPATAALVAGALVGEVALAVDGGALGGLASTVVDLTGSAPRVLRAGAIAEEAIAEAALP